MNQIHPSESELVKLVTQGNELAFKQLFLTYKDKLYNFSLRYVKSNELAEEIVQETFIKIWEARSGLDPEQCFGAYLFRIARNAIINGLKKAAFEANHKKQVIRYIPKAANATESSLFLADYEQLTEKVLAQLPPQRRAIFLLSRFEGLSHQEIASKMDISPNTVKVQMNKALHTLRRYFSQYSDITFILLSPIITLF